MMKILFLAVVMVITGASPSLAQNREALCHLLPPPSFATQAGYVPGVDVNGNSVVSAHVPQGIHESADIIKIPVTSDLAWNLTQQLPQGIKLETPLTMLEIHKDGRVTINDTDVTNAAYALCGRAHSDSEIMTKEEPVMLQPETSPLSLKQQPEDGIIWSKDR